MNLPRFATCSRSMLARFGTLLALLTSFAACGRALAEQPKPRADKAAKAADEDAKELGTDWVRILYSDSGEPVAMQTAIITYRAEKADGAKGKPVEVDLIGAVHIGDVAYYRQLNDRFKKYDSLLYELVAPEGTVVERGRGSSNSHPLGAMQNGMKQFLELDHQLEKIDYTAPNFVHADMSPDEFMQSMKDRNESFFSMYFKLLGQAMAHQSEQQAKGESSDFELLSALLSNDRPRLLKITLGKQLAEMESLMVSFGGEQGSVIISERNKKALGVLKKELEAGKRHLAIFYGAGHLNDMNERLQSEFHLKPVAITWLTAWNLEPQP